MLFGEVDTIQRNLRRRSGAKVSQCQGRSGSIDSVSNQAYCEAFCSFHDEDHDYQALYDQVYHNHMYSNHVCHKHAYKQH